MPIEPLLSGMCFSGPLVGNDLKDCVHRFTLTYVQGRTRTEHLFTLLVILKSEQLKTM